MSQEQIEQLKLIEQQLSAVVSQKQMLQKKVLECESAISELNSTTTSYQIVGSVMVQKNPEELKKEVEEDLTLSKERVAQFETQEIKLRDQAKELQEQVVADFKKE